MGRYREYMTGRRLRDPPTPSDDGRSPPSQTTLSSDADVRPTRRHEDARTKDRTADPDHDYHHQIKSSHNDAYRSPIHSRRRTQRESSEDSPPPKRRRNDSMGDRDRSERRHRGISSSPERRGKRRDGYKREHHRDLNSRVTSPPRHRRESSRNQKGKRSISPRDSSPSPAPRHRHRESRGHRQESQRKRSRSHSPRRRRHRSPRPVAAQAVRSHAPLLSQEDAFAMKSGSYRPSHPEAPKKTTSPPPPKQAPNYAPSGLLAAETNTVANTSIVLKYHEPPSARLPPSTDQWRLFVFKGDSLISTLALHERSCWLFGRERLVADYATDHPSCSKQHAVIQFRFTEVKNEEGEPVSGVRPYLIDLESANGTKLNGKGIPEKRYVELKTTDVITFGESGREYVVILPPKK